MCDCCKNCKNYKPKSNIKIELQNKINKKVEELLYKPMPINYKVEYGKLLKELEISNNISKYYRDELNKLRSSIKEEQKNENRIQRKKI